MSLIIRFAFFALILGGIIGFFLRALLGNHAHKTLLLISYIPWFLHALYLNTRVSSLVSAGELAVFWGTGVLLAGVSAGVAWRFLRSGSRIWAFAPLLQLLLYAAPLAWFARLLRPRGFILDVIPTGVLVLGSLLVFAALVMYAWTGKQKR